MPNTAPDSCSMDQDAHSLPHNGPIHKLLNMWVSIAEHVQRQTQHQIPAAWIGTASPHGSCHNLKLSYIRPPAYPKEEVKLSTLHEEWGVNTAPQEFIITFSPLLSISSAKHSTRFLQNGLGLLAHIVLPTIPSLATLGLLAYPRRLSHHTLHGLTRKQSYNNEEEIAVSLRETEG